MKMMRSIVTLSYDSVMAGVAFCGALMIRYDGHIPEEASGLVWYGFSYAFVCLALFYMMGIHRYIWRYTSTRDLIYLSYGVMGTMVATGGLIFFLTRLEHFPRSAFIIMLLLHLALAVSPRILLRMAHDRPFRHGVPRISDDIKNVLLIDGGDAADMFIRECQRQHPKQYNICGILDDEPSKQGRSLHGIPVLGPIVSLPKTLDHYAGSKHEIDMLIITDRRPANMSGFMDVASARGIQVKRLPNISKLEEGEKLTNLKPVLIEDLLGRETVSLDMAAIEGLVKNQVVMVTGAGGSIGSELCRQIAERQPSLLVMVDHSELALYKIDMEISKKFSAVEQKQLLLDVKSSKDIQEALKQFGVDVIFHAAAYKHVPIVEDNPVSGIENNLFGTATVADAAMATGVKRMVIISTDKAVNPTNVMGATKRAAEIYCQNLKGETQIMTVRFGNVLGSTGSVVPLFTQQIRSGGPLTVTHKDVTRYFMTIPEAVQLVLQASTLGKGGEIFMLDMGKPVKIWDMAEEMIRLSGLVPHEDIQIEEVGLRPGEKMYEELSYDAETMGKTEIEKIFLVNSVNMDEQSLKQCVDSISIACAREDSFAAVKALRTFVPEYIPASNSPYAQDDEKSAAKN